jgi:hypothetical protein
MTKPSDQTIEQLLTEFPEPFVLIADGNKPRCYVLKTEDSVILRRDLREVLECGYQWQEIKPKVTR